MAVGKRRQLQTETGLDLGETLFAVKKGPVRWLSGI